MNIERDYSWSSGPMPQPWFSLSMAIAGLSSLGVCIYTVAEESTFAATAIRTSGTVVELKKGNSAFRPVISFIDQQGQSHTFISRVSSDPPAFHPGETVEVLYPTSSPEKARVYGFIEKWLVSLITGVIGFGLNLGSILSWVYRFRLFPQYAKEKNNS